MTQSTQDQRTGLAFWAPLIAISLALFIVVVDSTMMNVAVPTIVKDLNTNVHTRILTNGRFLNGVSMNVFQSIVITGMLFVLPLLITLGYAFLLA